MSYVDKNLLPGEQVVYRAHLHWIIYVPAALWALLGIAAIAVAMSVQDMHWIAFLGMLGLLVGAILAAASWIRDKTSEFAVTTKRVVIKLGLVRRYSLELLLRQVEEIRIGLGIRGRILGYGTLIIGGTGGTQEPFDRIANPLEFRRQVQAVTSN